MLSTARLIFRMLPTRNAILRKLRQTKLANRATVKPVHCVYLSSAVTRRHGIPGISDVPKGKGGGNGREYPPGINIGNVAHAITSFALKDNY